MANFPRIETGNMAWFITTKTAGAKLWLINRDVQLEVLKTVAKLADRYEVRVYMLSVRGNHIHMLISTPQLNRGSFMRDLNSETAKTVAKLVSNFPGGRLWARRYSGELTPRNEDIERMYWYGIFQAVQDGLVDDIDKDLSYNCYEDSITERQFDYTFVKWSEYNAAKRYNRSLDIKKYSYDVSFKFTRLPGYEALSPREYTAMMRSKRGAQHKIALEKREAKGHSGFAGVAALAAQKPGDAPKRTKKSHRNSKRPRVLSDDDATRQTWNDWTFQKYYAFKDASRKFRAGNLLIHFPDGMYRPYSGPTA